jgi:uncharacterized membrane protein
MRERPLFIATGVAPAYGFLYQASLTFFPALFVLVSCLGYLLVILLTGLTHRGLVAVDRAKERQEAETAEKLLLEEERREVNLQEREVELLMEQNKGAKKQLEGSAMEELLLEDGRGAKEVHEVDVAEKMLFEEERGTEELLKMDEQDKLLILGDRTVNEQADETEKKNLSMKETRGTKDEEPEGEKEKVLLEDRIRGNNENSKGKEMLLEESRGVKDQPDGEAKEHLHI